MEIARELQSLKDPIKAKNLARFFKTGKGEYGQGDVFLGITVPRQRTVAKKYSDLSFTELQQLLSGKIHEYRLTALLILISQFRKADLSTKKAIVNFYLKNTTNINNWDLVDLSAPSILGEYLLDKDKGILLKLTRSPRLWERRIAVLASFQLIKNYRFIESLKIAQILLKDKHDLIHKAVGWMLREIGKRNIAVEEQFLRKFSSQMPRTMLRYAIEKFPESQRLAFLDNSSPQKGKS